MSVLGLKGSAAPLVPMWVLCPHYTRNGRTASPSSWAWESALGQFHSDAPSPHPGTTCPEDTPLPSGLTCWNGAFPAYQWDSLLSSMTSSQFPCYWTYQIFLALPSSWNFLPCDFCHHLSWFSCLFWCALITADGHRASVSVLTLQTSHWARGRGILHFYYLNHYYMPGSPKYTLLAQIWLKHSYLFLIAYWCFQSNSHSTCLKCTHSVPLLSSPLKPAPHFWLLSPLLASYPVKFLAHALFKVYPIPNNFGLTISFLDDYGGLMEPSLVLGPSWVASLSTTAPLFLKFKEKSNHDLTLNSLSPSNTYNKNMPSQACAMSDYNQHGYHLLLKSIIGHVTTVP